MDAVVLVGGAGTRLRPLTYQIPKQMLPVVDRPMIVHVLSWLAGHGVDRAVLSLGYRPDAFIRAFPEDEVAGVALAYAVEPEPLDTAGAVRFAASSAGIGETFLVLNGDVLTEIDASGLVEHHRSNEAEATIALTPVADPSAFGVVPTDSHGRVVAFIEKPTFEEAPTNLINAGIYVLETSVLDRIPAGRRVSIERETFPELVSANALYALASDAYWIDTGTPQQYIQAQLDFLSGRHRLGAPPAPEIRSGVWVAEDVTIAGKLGPHSFVGRGASIAEGALVEDSVVGARSRIGMDAVVRRSVLMPDTELRAGSVVEDTVVGTGAVVGHGARLTGATIVGVGADVPPRACLDGARYPSS
jgi:mannose-1-phosphate guanylyltransferase